MIVDNDPWISRNKNVQKRSELSTGSLGYFDNQQSPSDSLYHFVPLGTLQTVVIMSLQSGFTALHRASSETKSPTPGSHHLSTPLSAAPDIVHLMVWWGQYKGDCWPIDFSKQQFHKLEYALDWQTGEAHCWTVLDHTEPISAWP